MEYKIWQPMKYATAKKTEVLAAALESSNYCIQLKKDGSSYVWAKDLDGSVHLYGDKISKKTGEVIDKIDNVPHMKGFAEKYFPCGSQVIVEICYGESSKDVNSIMLALPAKAEQRQRDTEVVKAYIFDVLYWDNQSWYQEDFADRWTATENIFRDIAADNFKLDNEDTYGFLPHWLGLATTFLEDKDEVIAEWLSTGEEGGVLKMLHSTPKTSAAHAVSEIGKTAKRPMNTCFKIKQVDTVDVVIIGIEMPTSIYTGKDPENHAYKDADGNAINRLYALGYANSFVIGAYKDNELVKIGTIASGLDDTVRRLAAECPDDFIGKTIEVDCMSKDVVAKTLRHPRLMKFRPDKSAEDCLMGEIF